MRKEFINNTMVLFPDEGKVIQNIHTEIYGKEIWLSETDSIDNYVEIDKPEVVDSNTMDYEYPEDFICEPMPDDE